MTQPRGGRAARPGRTARFPRAEISRRAPGVGRWGTLQGGLGVCIIVASAAVGAIVTMVARSAPGFLLGLFVVAGTVAASLAVRPRAGRMIFPVPVLSYLVAALISGVVFDRSADSSKTALAIGAAQWIADGFFAMALATVLAVVIIAARWYLWRRGRPATGDPAGQAPAGRLRQDWPARRLPDPAGTVRLADGTRWHGRQPRAGWETAESGYPAGFAGPGAAGEPEARPGGARGVPGVSGVRGRGPRVRGSGRSGLARHRPSSEPASRVGTLQLLQRGVTEHQVLDAVVGTEVDLRLGLVAVAVGRHHGAEAELVVGHHVPR